MKARSRVNGRNVFIFVVAMGGLNPGNLQASTLYWDSDATGIGNNVTSGVGLGGTGTWNTALLNWWSGSGTTDQAWLNANNYTVAFWGSTAGTVTLGANITVGGLLFNTSGYVLANGANTLTFGAANNIITLNTVAAATITGAVTGTGNVTLTGGVLNGSANTGTLNLNGTSTTGWSGTTTINYGMTLSLSGSNQALVSTSGITLNGGGITLSNNSIAEAALNRIADGAAITSNGGTLTIVNKSDVALSAYAETIGAVTLISGQLNILSTQSNLSGLSQTLTLGGLSPTGAATVAFGVNALGGTGLGTVKNQINVTGLASTTANQIIGSWATIGTSAASQTDFAVNNINAGTGNAFGIQGAGIAGTAQTLWLASTDSYTQSAAQTLNATRTISSLRNTAATATTQLGANNLETFGLLNGVGTTWTIASSGAGVIRQNGTAAANLHVTTGAGAITISAPITDNTGALTLVKSGTGGTLTLSGTNTYTGQTVVNAGVLQFTKQTAFYNNTPASWTADNLVVAGGAMAAFNIGGMGEFTSADIDTLAVLGSPTGGFKSSSAIGLDTTNAGGTFTYANVISDTNSGANVLGLTKLGSGNLTLSGAQTYTGPTTINNGSLTLSGGSDRLANAGTVIFGGATVALNLGGNNQTLAGLGSGNVASAATITGTGTLTLNGGFVQIGGTSGTQTVDMTSLSNFVYSNPTGTLNVGGANGNTAELSLASTNVITAGTFGVVTTGPSGDGQVGKVHLGQTNTINAGTIQVGGLAGNGTFDFQGGLTAPTLKIRGFGGTDSDRAAMIVGTSAGYASTTSVFTMGTTGVLDAKISTLLIAEGLRTGLNVPTVTGTFTMGIGTLDATSITVAKDQNVATSSGTASVGTFNLNGGTVTVGTLGLGYRMATGHAAVIGTFNLNNGNLYATTIQTPGTGGTSIVNWADGTIGNVTGANQTVTSISNFNLTNTGNTSGTHKWDVGGAQTSTVSAFLSGNGSLTKTNTGTLTLSGANTQTGSTTISDGKLIATFDGASTTLSNIAVTVVANNPTMTLASGSLQNGQRVVLTAVAGPSGLTTATTSYFVVNASGNTFQVSANLGGPAITPTTTGTTVAVSRAGAFGSTNSDIVLGDANTTTNNSSPSLLTGGAITIERGVTIANQSTSGIYTIGGNNAAVSTFSGLVTANQGFTVSQLTGGTLNITGGITGGSAGTKTVNFSNGGAVNVNTTAISDGLTGNLALTQSGVGTTTLGIANTYTGTTTITAGMLTLSNSLALQNSALDTLNSITGTSTVGLKTTVSTLTLGGLSGSKNLASVFTTTSGGYSAVTALTLNPGTGMSNTYAGIIANGGTGMTLTKTGAGTQILSGSNTYSGGTTVSGGKLLVNNTSGSGTGSGAVTVATVATLGGTGTIAGATTIDGAHAPTAQTSGSGQTFSNAITYGGSSIFEWDLNAATSDPGVVANSGSYGQVVANGTVSGTSVFTVVLGLNAFTDAFWDTDKTWTNIFTGSSAPTNLAALFPSFGGSGVDSGGLVAGQGQFTFNGGTTLSWSAVPEPTSAFAGLLLSAGLLRRRRQ